MSRTVPHPIDHVWRVLVSEAGIAVWLGSRVTFRGDVGETFETEEGTTGELRSYRPGDRVRLTWQPIDWDHDSTLQIALGDKGDRTVLRFHQERLADSHERQRQRAHWKNVTDQFTRLLADWGSDALPVSVKGVVVIDGSVVLLGNERDEWELPGGRIDPDDTSPEAALRRECAEELGIDVSVGDLIDEWVYEPLPGRRVRIETYRCTTADPPDALRVSDEHTAVMVAPLPLADDLPLPAGYRRSIEQATTPG